MIGGEKEYEKQTDEQNNVVDSPKEERYWKDVVAKMIEEGSHTIHFLKEKQKREKNCEKRSTFRWTQRSDNIEKSKFDIEKSKFDRKSLNTRSVISVIFIFLGFAPQAKLNPNDLFYFIR